MVEIKITDNDANQRLNKYLMKYLNEATSSFIYKMLRKKNIVLNDKKAQGDEILSSGDCIKLYLADETIEKFRTAKKTVENGATFGNQGFVKDLSRNLKILYEDKDIMAVHKEPGVLSQKADKKDYSINEAIIDYIARSEKYVHSDAFTPSVCNRLDKNTSGIILAGITLKGSQYLSKVLKDRELDKFYFTIVKGCFPNAMTCQAYISKDRDKNLSKVYSEDEYKKLSKDKSFNPKDYSLIKTQFIPVSSKNGNTLLKIKLITGKSHQIRAHLKYLGYPMAGDVKYGNKSYNSYMRDKYKLKNHLLHAGIVKLNADVIIEDPLPDIFLRICQGEGLKIN